MTHLPSLRLLTSSYSWEMKSKSVVGDPRRPSSPHQWVAMSNPRGATRPRMTSGGTPVFGVVVVVAVFGRVSVGEEGGLVRLPCFHREGGERGVRVHQAGSLG